MSLAEKIRKAREVKVEAGGFSFTVRRPTALEMMELQKQSAARAVIPFVVGWGEEVTELAMFGTGAPHPVPFDPAVCFEWLQDRLDLLAVLIKAVFQAYEDHQVKLAELTKN